VRSGKFYMTIRYCGTCLHDYAVDLEHGGVPNANKLGVKMGRPWALERAG
jgi:hypothetical protein